MWGLARWLFPCQHPAPVRETKTINGRRVAGYRCHNCDCWSPIILERLTLEEQQRATWPAEEERDGHGTEDDN